MLVRSLAIASLSLLASIICGCSSVSGPPSADAAQFTPGRTRANVEAMIGTPRSVEGLKQGQVRATYEVLLVPTRARVPRALALDALRPDGSGQTGLALMIHKDGRAGMGPNDLASTAANMAAEYIMERLSDSPPPAKQEHNRRDDDALGRRCRIEVVYDPHGRLLHRRITPLDEPSPTVTRWEDVPAPVGADAAR